MTLTYFYLLTSITVIIPFIAALMNPGLLYKKNHWLFLYLTITVATESICLPLFLLEKNNLWIYSLYTVLEFPLLALAMVSGFKNYRKYLIVITVFTLLLSAVAILDEVKYMDGNKINALSTASELLLLMGTALYTFYQIMENKEDLYIQKSPKFWLAAGVLIYSAGSFFFFLSNHYYSLANLPTPREYGILHSSFNFIFQIILTKSVLCYLNMRQAG